MRKFSKRTVVQGISSDMVSFLLGLCSSNSLVSYTIRGIIALALPRSCRMLRSSETKKEAALVLSIYKSSPIYFANAGSIDYINIEMNYTSADITIYGTQIKCGR